jgi:hypothetical protein
VLPARSATLAADHPLGRAARVGSVLGVFAALIVLHVPLCPFALVTGRPCPGCGLGRATLALFAGDLGAAVHAHPLAPVLSPLILGGLAYNAAVYVRRGRWGAAEGLQGRALTAVVAVLFALLIGVWLARFLGFFGGPVPV